MDQDRYNDMRNDAHQCTDQALARKLARVEREIRKAISAQDFGAWSSLTDCAQVLRDEVAYRANPPQNDEID